MRWLVYLLILVNLVVAFWIYQNRGWESEPESRFKPPIGEMKIVSGNQVPGTTAKPEPLITHCYRSGPFDEMPTATEVVDAILNEGIKAKLSREDYNKPRGYWVILPSQTMDRAGIIQSLFEAGIEDAWIISDGAHEGGISLGLFRERNNAVLRSSEVEALDLQPKIIERSSDESRYWVVIERESDKPIESNLMNRLAILARGQSFTSFACEEIVPVERNE